MEVNIEGAFKSSVFRRVLNLRDKLKAKYGYVTGDINWELSFWWRQFMTERWKNYWKDSSRISKK